MWNTQILRFSKTGDGTLVQVEVEFSKGEATHVVPFKVSSQAQLDSAIKAQISKLDNADTLISQLSFGPYTITPDVTNPERKAFFDKYSKLQNMLELVDKGVITRLSLTDLEADVKAAYKEEYFD
jgi:hypothetical protein